MRLRLRLRLSDESNNMENGKSIINSNDTEEIKEFINVVTFRKSAPGGSEWV